MAPLTAKTFAALPKTKISALYASADRSRDLLVARAARLTNCAQLLICIGSLDFALRRSDAVIDPKLKLCLGEVLFAYQLDWRYPKPFGITIDDMDASPPDRALRRAYAEPFFSFLERTPGNFSSESAWSVVSYTVRLTRHLLGTQSAAYNAWLTAVIDRLTRVATDPVPKASIYLLDYPSRKAWEAMIEKRHGRPLPLELLDVSREMPPERKWPALIAATMARLSPTTNPLLQPRATLIKRGLKKPYAR